MLRYEFGFDKSKILTNKKLIAVEELSDGIKVQCADGSTYRGHILAGADGVYSKARQAMWQLAKVVDPDLVQRDEKGMYVDLMYPNSPLFRDQMRESDCV